MQEHLIPRSRPDDILGASKDTLEAHEREHAPSAKTLAEFLNVSQEEFGSFKKRLLQAGGHLRIWVHPLYTEQWPGTTKGRLGNADLSEVQAKLRTSFFKATSSVVRNLNSAPLVVYEATKKLEGTRNLIASHLKCDPGDLAKLGIIFVPTEVTSSELDHSCLVRSLQSGDEGDRAEAEKLLEFRKAVDDFVELSEKHRQEVEEKFPQLAKDPFSPMSQSEQNSYAELTIRQGRDMKPVQDAYRHARKKDLLSARRFVLSLYNQIGLKSALVSGAYLEVGQNYETKKPELQACAGSVVNELRGAGIATDISTNIWPPKELIKAAGFDVKQTKRG